MAIMFHLVSVETEALKTAVTLNSGPLNFFPPLTVSHPYLSSLVSFECGGLGFKAFGYQ